MPVPSAHHAPPRSFPQLIAYKSADVNGEHARTALRNGYEVKKLCLVKPVITVNDLLFNERYHGITAAEGHYANAEESLEQCPVADVCTVH